MLKLKRNIDWSKVPRGTDVVAFNNNDPVAYFSFFAEYIPERKDKFLVYYEDEEGNYHEEYFDNCDIEASLLNKEWLAPLPDKFKEVTQLVAKDYDCIWNLQDLVDANPLCQLLIDTRNPFLSSILVKPLKENLDDGPEFLRLEMTETGWRYAGNLFATTELLSTFELNVPIEIAMRRVYALCLEQENLEDARRKAEHRYD